MSIKRIVIVSGALAAAAVAAVCFLAGYGKLLSKKQEAAWKNSFPAREEGMDEGKIRKTGQLLRERLNGLAPKGVYIVIDTAANRFSLRKGSETFREGLCSTGKGDILPDPRGKKKWVFDTPRGEFSVRSKIKNPYWNKPEWAFIEDGEPIPKKKEDRVVGGELGDYALGFGDGTYFLHGTLYTRMLGRSVTHGCVRFGDEDLEVMFKSSSIGTKIYIF